MGIRNRVHPVNSRQFPLRAALCGPFASIRFSPPPQQNLRQALRSGISILVTFNTDQTVAMLAGTSFAAGLNVYATIATLGLLSRTGVIILPASLDVLQSWWIIGVALAMFRLEFFDDKVPAFDLIWNALHTFIRVPIAVLLAYAATSHLSLGMQLASAALGGLIAK